jgi:predicted RNA-binding Zn ribbon-like protein
MVSDGPRSSPASEVLTPQELLSVIARDLIDLMCDDERRSRLRACASEVCQMIYVDAARGRPRKWCSMQRCGNQAKAAAHRRKSSPSPDSGHNSGSGSGSM